MISQTLAQTLKGNPLPAPPRQELRINGKTFHITPMLPDGNCFFFRVLAHLQFNNQNFHDICRKKVICEVIKNLANGLPFKSAKHYCLIASQSSYWATHVEILRAAVIYKHYIQIVTNDAIIPIGQEIDRCVYIQQVGSFHSGHFNLFKLVSTSNTSPKHA